MAIYDMLLPLPLPVLLFSIRHLVPFVTNLQSYMVPFVMTISIILCPHISCHCNHIWSHKNITIISGPTVSYNRVLGTVIMNFLIFQFDCRICPGKTSILKTALSRSPNDEIKCRFI